MDVPWSISTIPRTDEPVAGGALGSSARNRCGGDDAPWMQHVRLQTQQELCAKRFLRFASLSHAHGAVALWAAALLLAGVHPTLAVLPIIYFTAPVALGWRHLPSCDLEQLSTLILVLNGCNAVHLAAICMVEGNRVVASPLFALVALPRVLFGLFTRELHCHLGLSTFIVLLATFTYRPDGGSFTAHQIAFIMICALLLELTAVVVLAEGPCGYEEAVMYLAQIRAQHQLIRTQALQRIDLEREEFSGQLLAIATQGIAELTSSVQRASEPVLSMLKSSCATGTKSTHEAERIGRIGEALKEEVAEILRYKVQKTWSLLQEHAKERSQKLREYATSQEEASNAIFRSLHKQIGRPLAQMHQLELEAESSLEQLIQSEVNRAMETVDTRMDLVRQSAQAMERRVSETVEVLLSLLKYFRYRGSGVSAVPSSTLTRPHVATKAALQGPVLAPRPRGPQNNIPPKRNGIGVTVLQRRSPTNDACSPRYAATGSVGIGSCGDEAATATGNKDASAVEGLMKGKPRGALPSIHEKEAPSMLDVENEFDLCGSASSSHGSVAAVAVDEFCNIHGNETATHSTASVHSGAADDDTSGTCESEHCTSDSNAVDDVQSGVDGQQSDIASDGGHSGSGTSTLPSVPQSVEAGTRGVAASASKVPRSVIERHPLFATRLCYRTEEFFWSWASTRDFRAELDALRVWHRASSQRRHATSGTPTSGAGDTVSDTQTGCSLTGVTRGTKPNPHQSHLSQTAPSASGDGLLPTEVFIDLSKVPEESIRGFREWSESNR